MQAFSRSAAIETAGLHHRLAISVERVIDDPLGRIERVIVFVAEMPEAFGDRFEARTLRLTIQRVVGIGAVDNVPQQHECGVAGQLVFL